MKEIIEIVKRRINFVKKLNELKANFQKDKLIHDFHYVESMKLLFQDYTALRFYLLLTCFDIIGQQQQGFLSFKSWLQSSSTKEERDNIINKVSKESLLDDINFIHDKYLELYGVRNSFNYFINEVLSGRNRKRLYASIEIKKEVVSIYGGERAHIRQDKDYLSNEIRNQLTAQSLDWQPTTKHKQNFLYNIRNLFTHKGISMADWANGVYTVDACDYELLQPTYESMLNEKLSEFEYMWQRVHEEESDSFRKFYQVKGWPNILIEILEETLNELSK